MNKYLEAFKRFMKVEKGNADNTISSYLTDLQKFSNFIEKDLLEVDLSDVRKYLTYLTDLGRKRSTVSRTVMAIRGFYSFAENEYGKESPVKNLHASVREKSLPKYLSMDDTIKLLKVASKSTRKTNLIVELLYGSGCRVSELVNLQVKDVDLEQGFIQINGKGSKERIVPIPDHTLNLLRDYIKHNNIVSGYIFTKRGSESEPMSRISVTNLLKNIGKRAGVNANVSAHVMRHCYAQHMLDAGCELAVLQELLGHEDISTTRVYARVTKKLKRDNLNTFHPLSSR